MSDTQARVDDARRKIEIVEEFMADIERVGGAVPEPLKKAVDRYLLAAKLGTDMAEAAGEVSAQLTLIYEDLYRICEAKTGYRKGRPNSMDAADQYAICQARVDRQWQRRNVEQVLDWNTDGSWVRRVWDKWWERLLEAVDFVEAEKRENNVPREGGRLINPRQ